MKVRLFLFFLCCMALPAAASVITIGSLLPPGTGSYVADFHSYPGIDLTDIRHSGFIGVTRHDSGADEIEDFGSTVRATGMAFGSTFPVELHGPVQVVVHGKVGSPTGTFDTEMLSMNLTGVTPLGPVMIRESPTLPSLGKTSIDDLGGGLYRMDSFFDIFTELSLDGGNTWIPSTAPSRVTLVPTVPEPATLTLFGLGALGLLRRRRG